MLGPTFSDLDDKAQEFQDQAAADIMSTTTAAPARIPMKEKQPDESSLWSQRQHSPEPTTSPVVQVAQQQLPQQVQAAKQKFVEHSSPRVFSPVMKEEIGLPNDNARRIEPISVGDGFPPVTMTEQERYECSDELERESWPPESDIATPNQPYLASAQTTTSSNNVQEGAVSSSQSHTVIEKAASGLVDDDGNQKVDPPSVESSPVTVCRDHDMASTPGESGPVSQMSSTPITPEGRKKLIVLISSMPMNRQVQSRQDLAMTILDCNDVDFEVLDGVEEKDLRNELFSISGRRGEYPQFFLINLPQGHTTFWGGWDEFQLENENGNIRNVFPNTPALKSMNSPDTPNTADISDETVLVNPMEEALLAVPTLMEHEYNAKDLEKDELLQSLENKLAQAETKMAQMDNQCQQLQTDLAETRNELTASRNDCEELKQRAKLNDMELNEERAAAQKLQWKIEEMEAEHQRLLQEIVTLKGQLHQQSLLQAEKDEEMHSLRNDLVRMTENYKNAECERKDQDRKYQHTLATYVKQFQLELAVANSRAEAALQAQEEAELEARELSSIADWAFERAKGATLSSGNDVTSDWEVWA